MPDEFILDDNPSASAKDPLPLIAVSLPIPVHEKLCKVAAGLNYTPRQLAKEIVLQSMKAINKGGK